MRKCPKAAIRSGVMRMVVRIFGCGIAGLSSELAAPISLLAKTSESGTFGKSTIQAAGRSVPAWICDGKSGSLEFKSRVPAPLPPDGCVYLGICHLDQGYGKLDVKLTAQGSPPLGPDRFLGVARTNRGIKSETTDAVVDFLRNDPHYGGNHVIGGILSNWRTMDTTWQDHFRKYQSILTWMPKSHADDLADFTKMGITYYPHVKPGFSWANLKHLPTGDETASYQSREGGRFYWNQLTDAAQGWADRLFVGMFDEYDEATAIMPMSDDTPATPERPGVGATFYNGANPQENGEFVLLPKVELELGVPSAGMKTNVDHLFVKMGGRITFPKAGAYTFSVQGAVDDGIELFLNGRSVLHSAALKESILTAGQPVTAAKGDSMAFRLECRHRTGKGTLRLLWEAPGMARQPVPAGALRDAWGRFITNEGKPPDWWLQLTRMGKEMIKGRRKPSDPVPEPRSRTGGIMGGLTLQTTS